MIKNQKGITLIALVITIIVLLILAGVSIAMLTGDNGILTQATTASSNTKVANAKEVATTNVAAKYSEFMEYKYVKEPTSTMEFTDYLSEAEHKMVDTEYYTIQGTGTTIKISFNTDKGETVTGTINNNGSINWDK